MEDGTMIAILAVFFPILLLIGFVAALISDIGIDIITGGVFLFLFIFGIALITSHGIGMVAGVNTMTESEKKEYDLLKVGRATGICMIAWSGFPLLILVDGILSLVYCVACVVLIIWLVWYANFRCRIQQ